MIIYYINRNTAVEFPLFSSLSFDYFIVLLERVSFRVSVKIIDVGSDNIRVNIIMKRR